MLFRRLAVVCLLVFLPCLAVAQEQIAARLFSEAQAHLRAGNYQLASEGFARIWKIQTGALGEDNPATIEARIFHGQMLTMTGKPEEAMTVLGPVSHGDSRNAMIARGSFALALRQAGQLDRAVKILRELVRTFPSGTVEDKIQLGRMHSELAVCLAYLGHAAKAEAHALEALRLLDAAGNPVPTHRAAVNIILGQIYLLVGRDAEAHRVLIAARKEAEPFWLPSHPEIGILEGALGMAAYRAGRYEESETLTRRSFESLEKLLGPNHPEVGGLSRQLALVLKKLKRNDESREWEARAHQILDHPRAAPKVSVWSWREVK